MPKKQNRQISKPVSDAKPAASASTFATSGQVFSNEFNPDYSHVFSDLKRIALMAVSFTIVLVALSFFIK
jgi:hypothetical protein